MWQLSKLPFFVMVSISLLWWWPFVIFDVVNIRRLWGTHKPAFKLMEPWHSNQMHLLSWWLFRNYGKFSSKVIFGCITYQKNQKHDPNGHHLNKSYFRAAFKSVWYPKEKTFNTWKIFSYYQYLANIVSSTNIGHGSDAKQSAGRKSCGSIFCQ